MEVNDMIDNYLEDNFNIDKRLAALARDCESDLHDIFLQIEQRATYNQLKVLQAMQRHRLSEAHFAPTTGYGYNDMGRETLESIYASVFGTEAALVRPQFISGTHAISTAMFGVLRPGDELLYVSGRPYDTMLKVIGVHPSAGSLAEYGITYKEVSLTKDGKPDFAAIRAAISQKTRVAAIQRSRGYEWRHSFPVDEINEIIDFVKSIRKDIICFTDNCYGEFTEPAEPAADIMAGSLIKNPGGGIAPVGGYIAGRADLVFAAACRLNTPGAGGEAGPSLGFTHSFMQGLFAAPQTVKGALKGAVFGARIFERLGVAHTPGAFEKRADIVQAAKLGSPGAVSAFCAGVQKAAPVDSFVTPEAWDMPGYDCPVIMAAGAFIQGSSMELSADAPMREPYAVYFQGGLSYDHSRLGILMGLNEMLKNGFLSL